MYQHLWNAVHASVCSLSFYTDDHLLGSGSGFKVDHYLITNNHVIQIPSATQVVIRFVDRDGCTIVTQQAFTIEEFRLRLRAGAEEQSWDYAILDMIGTDLMGRPGLHLAETDDCPIGSSVALFGFPFGQNRLSIHTGIIASKFVQANVHYLQLDASVNAGNSGGPLIRPDTGEVIGLVTRKEAGLTELFDFVLGGIQSTLDSDRSFPPYLSHHPERRLQAIQDTIYIQLKLLMQEIAHSANVGIGYAFELREIRWSLRSLE